jgi:hypothetical protein
MDSFGLQDVAGKEHTPQFNGGSGWATYWIETIRERAPSLVKRGHVTGKNARGAPRSLSEPTSFDQRHHLHCELEAKAGVTMRQLNAVLRKLHLEPSSGQARQSGRNKILRLLARNFSGL